MVRKLVIWGTGGHALVVADIIRLGGEYEIVGFLSDSDSSHYGSNFCKAPILGGREQLDNLISEGVKYLILGIGDCLTRLELAELARLKGLSLATAIHPRAVVASSASIAAGTVITAGAVINPSAKIGSNVIINTCASVDHESIIKDGVHIGPGVHLAGKVTIGRATWIGIGATVVDRVRVGSGTLIGAGAVVVNDIPDNVVAYGVPARVIREIVKNVN
ncbi:acetyltransferase [Leptolyngbya sp. FACHB-261]|nr:acetyltransferase [Leptolyngbya sp. FACHB-261]